MEDQRPPAVLSYAAPRRYLDRPFRHRSWQQAVMCTALLCFVALPLFMAREMARDRSLSPWAPRAFVALAAAMTAGVIWNVVKAVRDDRDEAQITEEGICLKYKVYRWDEIGTVFATKDALGISLSFLLRRGIRSRGFMTTPPLTLGEYHELIDTLTADVSPRHPHVKFERDPRRSD